MVANVPYDAAIPSASPKFGSVGGPFFSPVTFENPLNASAIVQKPGRIL